MNVSKATDQDSLAPFKTLSGEIVWSSKWYRVRQDQILLPDGTRGVYNVVEHPGAAWIIPVTASGDVVLLRHYRYTVGEWCWEIPAGSIAPGKNPEESAAQELQEEVGGTAGELAYMGRFYPNNGISNEIAYIYIASDVVLGSTAHEPAEVIEVHRRPIEEVLRMARDNEISDGPSALAILLCEKQLLELAADG